MRSMLAVTEAADDLQLLTIAEMRAAAGVSDGSQDVTLKARGLAIAANIMAECNIAVGSGNDPTLLQETLTETFFGVEVNDLILARRHNVVIVSITENGSPLVDEDRIVNPESGIVTRLANDCPRRWCARKIVVVYVAGFEEVPSSLKQAAIDYFRAVTMESDRDPYVKAESIDVAGVESRRTELWSGALAGTVSQNAMPDMVSGQLTRFRNPGGV